MNYDTPTPAHFRLPSAPRIETRLIWVGAALAGGGLGLVLGALLFF